MIASKRFLAVSLHFIVLILPVSYSYADNFDIGVHSGYGILKFGEKENFRGNNFESDSKHNVILSVLSGEYSFTNPKNFFIGITTDWTFGLKDEEKWEQNNIQVQTNDMKVFVQFYDLGLGYKNSLDNFYYRFYISGGWDGLRFKRDNIIFQGNPVSDSTEDISLWKIGAGTGLGFKKENWLLDGKLSYAYYPDGETEDSSLPNQKFDTKGTRLNFVIGVTREIAKNTSLYLGGDYTLQKLKGDTSDMNITWRTKLEILAGIISLTHVF